MYFVDFTVRIRAPKQSVQFRNVLNLSSVNRLLIKGFR